MEVSLLQFVDDTIFFAENTLQNIICIKSIMRSFELVFVLKVNFHKSSLGGIAVNAHFIHRYAHLLNCSSMSLPFTYLGIPIRVNLRRECVGNIFR